MQESYSINGCTQCRIVSTSQRLIAREWEYQEWTLQDKCIRTQSWSTHLPHNAEGMPPNNIVSEALPVPRLKSFRHSPCHVFHTMVLCPQTRLLANRIYPAPAIILCTSLHDTANSLPDPTTFRDWPLLIYLVRAVTGNLIVVFSYRLTPEKLHMSCIWGYWMVQGTYCRSAASTSER